MEPQLNNSLTDGIHRKLEQEFKYHRLSEEIATQIQLVEDLSQLSLSKNKRLAQESRKKIQEIQKLADDNDIDVVGTLSNYFTTVAQNQIFENVKHMRQDVERGIMDDADVAL